MFKRGKKSMVGVDIGSSSVKAVELQGKNVATFSCSASDSKHCNPIPSWTDRSWN